MYKNRITKPVKIVLKEEKMIRKNCRGAEIDQVHFIHVWKYHNDVPLYN
jgi:hypothetical protein